MRASFESQTSDTLKSRLTLYQRVTVIQTCQGLHKLNTLRILHTDVSMQVCYEHLNWFKNYLTLNAPMDSHFGIINKLGDGPLYNLRGNQL